MQQVNEDGSIDAQAAETIDSEEQMAADANNTERQGFWQRLGASFRNRNIGKQRRGNQLRTTGNRLSLTIDRYIHRRRCPYCFGYVTSRFYREVTQEGGTVGDVNMAKDPVRIYVCPGCEAQLPRDFFASRSTSIALVGGASSGKTSFITIFCELLINRKSALDELGITGSIINEKGEEQFTYNRRLLIGQERTLNPTTGMPSPIVVCLRSNHHKKAMYITLMDSPGEHFSKLDELVALHPNLHYADGIVFLMNPLDIPEVQQLIRKERPGFLPDNLLINAQNKKIIETLHEMYMVSGRVKPNRRIHIPTAFCLSRADLLEDISCLHLPPDFEPDLGDVHAILQEMNMVTEDLQQLLEETDPKLLNTMRRLFKQFGIFPVSPLGKMPTTDSVGQRVIGGVDPKGVLQPIIWILSATKFIQQ